jgi:uroporphyrinogen decarboxylase
VGARSAPFRADPVVEGPKVVAACDHPYVNEVFLDACKGAAVDAVPVWFMRQAGRSMPEYRSLRAHHDILALCRDPHLAAEVTLQPVRRYRVDAAILFSDIVVPLEAMGMEVDIRRGVGPVITDPIRDTGDVDRLAGFDPAQETAFVLETIRLLRRELEVPLIGFGGAPFTLASYLIEGGPSKSHARTKALMYGSPQTWHKLMDRLADAVGIFLRAQVDAGANAIQLFDSWVGHLAPAEYEAFALPSVERILSGLEGLGAPRILFGVGTGELLADMASSGADVIGVDWRVPLDEARRRTGGRVALQGNLDPAALLAPWEAIEERALDVLQRGGGRAHIFNLGHGVHPDTDPEVLRRLVGLVHAWRPR